jgi:hypothetical protein
VLVKELQSLALDVEVFNENEESIQLSKEDSADLPSLGFSLKLPGSMTGRRR